MTRSCVFIALGITLLAMQPAAEAQQQDEEVHQLRVNPALLNPNTQDVARRELANANRPQLDLNADRIRDLGIDVQALDQGRYTAVINNNAQVVDATNFAQALDNGAVLFARTAAAAIEQPAPDALMAEDPDATTYALGFELTTREGRFKAWGRDRTGLNFVGSTSGGYAGEIDVALSRIDNPADRSDLNDPVSVSISASGASRIAPDELSIDRLNDWTTVEIGVPNTDLDSYVVSISANPQDDGDRISLPVNRPRATLTATPRVITGWGIGKSKIRVQLFGARSPQGYKLALTSDYGTLGEVDVTLDEQGAGQVWLWSSRHPNAEIELADVNVVGESIKVTFEPPWIYLALAIVGGLVAAILKGRGKHQWARALVVGALSGVVMALLYSVGVNWLGRMFPDDDLAQGGEAIVFILGVFGAWVGVSAVLSKPSS